MAPSADSKEPILKDTLVCLKQGIRLMAQLNPDIYTRKHANCYNSTIGGHVRHNLDHFLSFEAGIKIGKVDYDARQREEFLETNPDYAAGKMEELTCFINWLASENLDQPLLVKMDSGIVEEAVVQWSHSSVRRELQFLISHTIHHYALIATLCSRDGIELPEDFGVAPSTLRFRIPRNAQCAQ